MKDKKTFLIIENFRGNERLKSEILNWSFDFDSQSKNNSGKNSGPTDLIVTRFSDKNYPLLMNALLAARFFPKITMVEENKSDGNSRILFSLFEILIANYQQSKGWDTGKLTETIIFKFRAYSLV